MQALMDNREKQLIRDKFKDNAYDLNLGRFERAKG